MKLGLWITARFDPATRPEQHFVALVEQVRLARDAGFGMVTSGQHHLAPRLQTMPLLARLLAEVGDMEIGTSILQLPLHHPVDVAEEAATLNVMSRGRFVLGLGLGHDSVEQATYGISKADRAARFGESLEVMDRIWTGDEHAWEGRFFRLPAHPGRTSIRARPRVWIGGDSRAALGRAAAFGAAWLPSNLDLDAIVERRAQLRELAAADDHELAPDAPAGVWLHVAPTAEAGRAAAQAAGHVDDAGRLRAGVIAGSPGSCRSALEDYRERGRLTHLLCRFEVPGMKQRDVLAAIELVGRSVLPALNTGPGRAETI